MNHSKWNKKRKRKMKMMAIMAMAMAMAMALVMQANLEIFIQISENNFKLYNYLITKIK